MFCSSAIARALWCSRLGVLGVAFMLCFCFVGGFVPGVVVLVGHSLVFLGLPSCSVSVFVGGVCAGGGRYGGCPAGGVCYRRG